MIEYQQTDDSSLNFFEMSDRNIQVEHILPRAYKNNSDWNYKIDRPDEVDKWINTGANLTLLSGKKNQQASNNGFESKVQTYRGKGLYSENSEGITAFRMTQQIVNDWDNGKFQKNWNLNSMDDRWQWFCSQVEVILEIDLSSIKKTSFSRFD